MLLRNYDNLMAMYNFPRIADGIKCDICDNLTVNNVSVYYNSNYKYKPLERFSNGTNEHLQSNQLPYGYSNLIIGSGDREVSYDDTALENIISKDFVTPVAHSVKQWIDEDSGDYISRYTKVFCATSAITVREIGVISGFYINSSSSGTAYHSALTYREVLNAPIEVPINANVAITLTIRQSPNPNAPTDYVATASVE